jgi:RNA polymerase sigma-70 factor (ECF subfamily)
LTTQPELPALAPPARPALYVAPPPAESDVDFDGFVRAYEARLRRLVLRRIGDLCEAEEITQETLLRAYQHRASFATEDELMAWSTVVAQRLVIDRVRVRGRSIAVAEVPESARLGRDTADIVVARHEARAALESLEAIPTRQAAILWAREVEGLHYEEIAERFGITEPAVRSLLHRGRKALRKEFKDRTGSLPLNGLVPFAPWLLALKAAGKVRGAAKTVGKSTATAAAALSISALVMATGVGPFGHGTGPGKAPAVRIDASRDRATYVTRAAAGEPVAAVDRAGIVHAASYGTTGAAPTSGGPGVPVWHADACVGTRLCLHGSDHEKLDTGGTIQIGPDLPENALGVGNVKVNSDYLDCKALALPDNRAVRCTQESESQKPDTHTYTSAPSSPSEGVLR